MSKRDAQQRRRGVEMDGGENGAKKENKWR